MRRGGRAIRSSGENKQRRIHTTQEKQTSYDIRSETIGCDTVRGEAEDVANANGQRLEGKFRSQLQGVGNGSTISSKTINKDVSNTNSKRLQRTEQFETHKGEAKTQQSVTKLSKTKRHSGKFERRLGGVVDGVPTWMDEPDIPRVTTNQAGRVQRLKMLGNAVVPQVVYQLGLAMKELWDEI